MTEEAYTLFETPIGRCGIAWGEHGITLLQLPEWADQETRARVVRRRPSATEARPPAAAQRAIDGILCLLNGQASKLEKIRLDMRRVPPFHQRVYEAARRIPPGQTLSYGDIAARLGASGAARAVGQALGRNPFAIIVPCHRVFAAGGKVGGFSARGGVTTKLRLLSLERGLVSSAARKAAAP